MRGKEGLWGTGNNTIHVTQNDLGLLCDGTGRTGGGAGKRRRGTKENEPVKHEISMKLQSGHWLFYMKLLKNSMNKTQHKSFRRKSMVMVSYLE